jgi:thiosulfate/3-mercaptopyruvate sulfurtransferase
MSHVHGRFVDCRWSLDDPDAGRRAYLEGHIPGAVFVDVEGDLAEPPGAGGRHPLPTAERFAAAMARSGIGDDTRVFAYGTLGGAERLWWLLRHFGHELCTIVSLDDWRGPLLAGEESVEPSTFVPQPRSGDTVERDELLARHAELLVVDARVPARWRGEANPVDRVPGRIPGALNAPWNEPLADLPDGEVVAYCGSGVTACVVLHRLHIAGRDGRLYAGSWSEWEQYPELPVERSQ